MNKNDVIVCAGKTGAVVNPSRNNPTFGYIRVTQSRMVVSEEGWAGKRTLSALINGTVDNLKDFNYAEGEVIPGKIRVVEKFEPFNPKNPERDLKIAGETGVTCSFEGKPIYRNAFYTTNLESEDILISHDNTEEIRASIAALSDANKADLS